LRGKIAWKTPGATSVVRRSRSLGLWRRERSAGVGGVRSGQQDNDVAGCSRPSQRGLDSGRPVHLVRRDRLTIQHVAGTHVVEGDHPLPHDLMTRRTVMVSGHMAAERGYRTHGIA